MKRVFHGLVIEDGAGEIPHPLAAFFAHFPEADADARVDLAFSVKRLKRLPRNDLRAPIFFHGVVQVSASAGGFLAEAPSLQVQLSRDARTLELFEKGDREPPFAAGIVHVMLLFTLHFFGIFDLHAGAARLVAGQRESPLTVLVLGESGAGKTTTTLALSQVAGFLGDDRVLVHDRDPLTLLAYPRALHVGDITRDLFPELSSRIVAGEPKREALVPAARVVLSSGPTRAILLPRITRNATTTARAATQGDAYGALLEASAIAFVETVPGRDANLACLKALSEVPAFHVDLGHDARNSARRLADVVTDALGGLA